MVSVPNGNGKQLLVFLERAFGAINALSCLRGIDRAQGAINFYGTRDRESIPRGPSREMTDSPY